MSAHFDAAGRPVMVDVSDKPPRARAARAEGEVRMRRETLSKALGEISGKGDVLRVAELAGIMAAKRTAELVPLCHPLPLTAVELRIDPDPDLPGLRVLAEARTTAPTGVEMEALTAVSIACLTVYDMLKHAERGIEIGNIRLLEKSGGKSGRWSQKAHDG